MINRGGAKVAPREVEEVLERHPGVVEAAAFALPHPTLGEAVAAAVVVRDPEQVTGSELRRYARSRLAAFKVPTRVVLVGQLPRGALGKVDRRKLAEMARSPASASGQPYADEVEAKLAGAFAEVLGIPQVGRDDSFFDLGGDSLRGVRVLVRVEQAFGISVSLDLLIDHPSVAEFAAAIRDLVSRQTHVQAGAAPTAPGSAAPAQMQRENR
jgi:acyl carrier protein